MDAPGPNQVFRLDELLALSHEELVEVVLSQASMIELLMSRVERLESEASKNSKNSSKPPSQDDQKRREERAKVRPKGSRRRGKQPGAPGHHLARIEDPDVIVLHHPTVCGGCGGSLDDAPVVGTESRQVFDIPEPTPFVTDHRAERRRCRCGHETLAPFPAEATAPACYGRRIRSLAVYMMCRQHLPVERTAELLSDVLGVSVSTGWLSGLVSEAGTALVPFCGHVVDLLRNSPVVGVDETGGRVGSKKHWFHVAVTDSLTLVHAYPSRGMAAVDDMGVLPGYEGVIVHDGLAMYDRFSEATHQQCNAHLVRALAGIGVVWDQTEWTEAMTTLLHEANAAAHQARDKGCGAVAKRTINTIGSRYDAILAQAFAGLPEGPPPKRRGQGHWHEYQRQAFNLAERMRTGKDDVLRFLTDTRIPFTNNESERGLRMVKIQSKISGSFQSEDGARNFARVRSYLQTAAKNGENLLGVLAQLFTTGAWLPAGP